MKSKLIDKLMERMSDLDTEEQLSMVKLDVYSVIEEAIQAKLESMTEDQILELL